MKITPGNNFHSATVTYKKIFTIYKYTINDYKPCTIVNFTTYLLPLKWWKMMKATIDLVESEGLRSDVIILIFIHQCYTVEIMWIILLILILI